MRQVRVSEADINLWKEARRAWLELRKHRSWDRWCTIGRALLNGRRFAMKQSQTNSPTGAAYSRAFNLWLEENKLDEINKSDRSALLKCMEDIGRVESWRQGLTETERLMLNHPRSMWRKFNSETKPKKAKLPKTTHAGGEDEDAAAELENEIALRKLVGRRILLARRHISLLETRLEQARQPVPKQPAALVETAGEEDIEPVLSDEAEEVLQSAKSIKAGMEFDDFDRDDTTDGRVTKRVLQ